ncbi:MAG: hypothetical protein V3V62_10000 [bacterium]
MALSDCPECGGMVSTEAIACPHCGYPRKGAAKTRRSLFEVIAQLPCFIVGLLVIFFVIVVIMILLDVYFVPGVFTKFFNLTFSQESLEPTH